MQNLIGDLSKYRGIDSYDSLTQTQCETQTNSCVQKSIWFVAAENFSQQYALIGYFEVTWKLTVKRFPAKISKRATLQNLWGQRVTVQSWQAPAVTESFNDFPASKFPDWELTVSLGTSH